MTACSSLAKMKSKSSASRETGTAPSRIISTFRELRPRLINQPRPLAPAKAAMVIVPTEATAAMRIPAMMKGAAMGSSTRNRQRVRVKPMPRATSRFLGSTLMMPV